MHSNMKITDEFYSNLNAEEIQKRINSLGESNGTEITNQEVTKLLKEFLSWKRNEKGS